MVDDNFQFALGPPESGFSIFLAERTKKIHFIRHAEVSTRAPRRRARRRCCVCVESRRERREKREKSIRPLVSGPGTY